MHDKKLIKKIFGLARYDFVQNFNNLMQLTGLLAACIIIVFGLLCSINAHYQPHLWRLPQLFLVDWKAMMMGITTVIKKEALFLEYTIIQRVMLFAFGLLKFMFSASLFVVIAQNCLDLAFDSSLSGFASIMQKRFFWIIGQLFGLSVLVQLLFLPLFLPVYLMLRYPTWYVVLQAIIVFYLLYVLQFGYIWAMHILEYQKGFWQTQKEVFQIAYDNILLSKVLLLQVIVAGLSTGAVYFLCDPVVNVFLGFMLWPCALFNVVTSPLLTMLLSNFLYAWAYLMVLTWICLVWAHLYRQLVCPPQDNPSCLSCSSCEK